MQKIVIFDMDGTLIDSKKDITISVNDVRQRNHNLSSLIKNYDRIYLCLILIYL